MTAHDSLLARQQLAGSVSVDAMSIQDVERLNVWVEQRTRLRQSMLGPDVARAWYQDEELQLQQILSELRRRNDGAAPAPDHAGAQQRDGNPTHDTHIYGTHQAARLEHLRQQAIEQASQSFAARARDPR